MVAKNLRTSYLYIISFIALMTMFGSSITAVSAIAGYAFPTKTVNYNYYDGYSYVDSTVKYDIDEYGNLVEPTDTVETASNTDIVAENNRIAALRSLVTSLVTFAVALILFLCHWIPIKNQHRKELAEEAALAESGVA
jgi:hypothetical protein